MTLDQINALAFEDSIWEVADRLHDELIALNRELPEGEAPVWADLEFLDLDQNPVAGPTLEAAQADFLIYKQELLDAENARLAEIARVEDIKSRWSLVTDIRAVVNASNPALELKRIIDEDDQATLTQIELDWDSHASDLSSKHEKSVRKELGKRAREACLGALDVVAGWNLERELTTDQVDQMTSSFSTILQLLQSNRFSSARAAIVEITPDGTLVTQEMKDEILEQLTI